MENKIVILDEISKGDFRERVIWKIKILEFVILS